MEIISSVVKAKGHDTKLDLPSQYRKLSTVSTKSRASIVSNILDITLEDDHPELAEESRKKGSLSRQTYWLYFRSGAGITLASLVLIFNILSQLMFSANDIWLASWTNQLSLIQSINDSSGTSLENHSMFNISPTDLKSNLVVYSLLIIALFGTTIARSTLFFQMCNRASVNLHNSIFFRLLRAPMNVFEENPLGELMFLLYS